MSRKSWFFIGAPLCGALVLGGCIRHLGDEGAGKRTNGPDVSQTVQGVVAGAGFTTFDPANTTTDPDDVGGGCLDNPTGINCNNYLAKQWVYMSGGPSNGGLSDGLYYFAVLRPGAQSGGWVDGQPGNLSDTTAYPAVAPSTVADTGIGRAFTNRIFRVTAHEIIYPVAGVTTLPAYATGTSKPLPATRPIVQLVPYDDTPNNGGVYVLALCKVTSTTDPVTSVTTYSPPNNPSGCKFDAFRVRVGTTSPEFPVVEGSKYYDLNANGQRDAGEVGIAAWPIDFTDGISDTITTATDGTFKVTLINDTYTFAEKVANHSWFQTGNLVNQTTTTGGAIVTLASKIYTVTVGDSSSVQNLHFGNLCVGSGGGHTKGYWTNKNGKAKFESTTGALAAMVALNLRNKDGTAFDPSNYTALRLWLRKAEAVNMAYMLSAQLAAMKLNVLSGFVSGGALIYAPGTTSANANGFASVTSVIAEADAALAAHECTFSTSDCDQCAGGASACDTSSRLLQEVIKNALDNANNDGTFVQSGPASCPTPVFP